MDRSALLAEEAELEGLGLLEGVERRSIPYYDQPLPPKRTPCAPRYPKISRPSIKFLVRVGPWQSSAHTVVVVRL